MQNAALAAAFFEIAEFLELAGDNPFKIRAYKRAAEAVVDLEIPIEDLAETPQLEEIEGLGEATIAKTREFLATGRIKLLEFLRSQYPPGLLDVLRVPGLGSKKVAMLYKEKGIDSLEKLVESLEAGELSGVAGFGPKSLENLRNNIRRLAELSTRLPIGPATHLAEKILMALGSEVQLAGSLRRGVDTVGNLNFVAATSQNAPIMEKFAGLPLVLNVLEQDDSKIRAKVHPGVEVELICVPPHRFGTALWERTGSAAHAQELEKHGLKAPEAATETEFFAQLGAQYIPAELREGQSEWQAALENRLPELLKVEDIRGDLHTHSTWSDGAATIRQMAQAMTARGYDYFCVSDHSKALAMANGLDARRLREQAEEIAEVGAEFPNLTIFRGIECDILRDGTMDLDDEILSELDFVIGSVHSAFNLPLAAQTERMIRAIQNPNVDMIAHPTGRVLGQRPPYDVNIPALIEAAHETGTALEINASERLDLKDSHAFLARERGVLLSIDSDAHSPRMLPNVAFGVATARRAWCEKKDILNAKSVGEVKKWLANRR